MPVTAHWAQARGHGGGKNNQQALEATKQHYRRYAKRQMTWFRADKRIRRLPADDGSVIAAWIDELIRQSAEEPD